MFQNNIDVTDIIWCKLKKVMFSHTPIALGPELIPVYRQSALRWLSHPPGGWLPLLSARFALPSQPKSIIAHRPVPNYTAWWQRHMRVSSLSKAVTWKQTGRDANPRPFESQANALPLRHTGHLPYDVTSSYDVRSWKSRCAWPKNKVNKRA